MLFSSDRTVFELAQGLQDAKASLITPGLFCHSTAIATICEA